MLLRFDPFRELDRATEQMLSRSPAALPMDAVRHGDQVVLRFDLPGVEPDDIDLTVERDTLLVRAARHDDRAEGDQVLAAERRFGTVTRQLLLGDNLDTEHLEAGYDRGVLTVTIPVAQAAKPRKVTVTSGPERAAIDTGVVGNEG